MIATGVPVDSSVPAPARPRIGRRFYVADLAVIAFSAFVLVLAVAFASRIPAWRLVVAQSAAMIGVVAGLAEWDARKASPAVSFLHDWYFAPLVYLIYVQLHWVIGPIHGGRIADATLIAIDRALFGAEPTAWFGRLAAPWLTEIVQAAYASFYLLIVAVGADLYRRPGRARFHVYVFACAYGFLASYLGYLLVPAVGPRFTLYEFSQLYRDLPGLWLTPALRAFVDAGGLVQEAASSSAALALANRDVFPSGHTTMTLVAIGWCWRERLAVRWGVTGIGVLLVFSTLYLRYHYAIDVIAGIGLATLCLATTDALHRRVAAWAGTRDRVIRPAVPPAPAAPDRLETGDRR